MRMLKKAAIAVAAAGSLTVLGTGTAFAGGPDVEANLHQNQTCTYQALIPVNLSLLAFNTNQGSINCVQSGKIG